MELTIQVDDTRFKDIISNEIKNMPHDVLAEIIKQAFIKYMMSNPNLISNLFMRDVGSYYRQIEPTYLSMSIVEKMDIGPECKEIAQALKDELKGHSKDIIESMLLKAMAKSIFDMAAGEGWLEREFITIANQRNESC